MVASLTPKVLIAMPAYNEAGRIENFIQELSQEIKGVELSFIVVDDASSDSTYESLVVLSTQDINIAVEQNLVNQGHGPSTIKALTLAVNQKPDCILMIDGDGHFDCTEVSNILTFFLENSYDIVEGVRIHRNDPFFRRIVSSITRWLVARESGVQPGDANTPLRLYKTETAKLLLTHIPRNSLIPNLHISSLTRTLPLKFREFQVKPYIRPSTVAIANPTMQQIGTSWGPSINVLPNSKFIKFCVKSTFEWLEISRTGKIE